MALVAAPFVLAATPTFGRGIRLEQLEAGTQILRIHHAANGPVWFGPKPGSAASSRFDASKGEYRVCYGAENLEGAFVETILHGRTKDPILARAFVAERAYSHLEVRRDLLLAKLYDDGLYFHGTDASVSAITDYTEPRRLALALFLEAPEVDGIVYRARHDNGERCYALFDRVADLDLPVRTTERFDADPTTLDRLAVRYGVIFDTSSPVPPP